MANPWPYYPPDYGDPNMAANNAYQLWLAQNRAAQSITAGVYGGLGEAQITPYPWKINDEDETPDERALRAQRRMELLDKISMGVGLIGGIMGLILSWRALRGRE